MFDYTRNLHSHSDNKPQYLGASELTRTFYIYVSESPTVSYLWCRQIYIDFDIARCVCHKNFVVLLFFLVWGTL